MSSKADQFKTNPLSFLVFLGTLLVVAWVFQNFVITPGFKSAMMGLFAPAEVKTATHENDDLIKEDEFLLDMTSGPGDVEFDYEKSSSQWVVRAEKLGEDAIIIEPWLTFGIFSIFVGFIVAVLVNSMIPRFGYIARKIEREIEHTIDRIDEQTGDKISREEIERITAANSHDDLTAIEKEFGPVIVDEINDVRAANKWKRTPFLVFKGLRLYMTRHFAEKYSNNVQGFAYGGAAILIVIIGIRGLKFIPPTQPSILLAAITLEFTMLMLLAVTLFYTEEEQRMDKLIRDLEESSEGQKFELINLVRTSQQQQRDLASMVDYIQRQTGDLKRMADALTGANKEYIIQVAQRAVAEYITQERSEEITEKVIRERIESAMKQMFGGGKALEDNNG
ncbi:MAG: hypothetical protein KDD67_04240 [Ignavibacteriae bacterium]|nr:hypothetical protein [Ignavibacteriota bacterium]MCB9217058.1 hypothetical protein [Ignavibacteria bacterium]